MGKANWLKNEMKHSCYQALSAHRRNKILYLKPISTIFTKFIPLS